MHNSCLEMPQLDMFGNETEMHLQKVLDQMGQEIQEMVQRSEVLGEQGDVDGAQAAATQAEAIKVRNCWTAHKGSLTACRKQGVDHSACILWLISAFLQARRATFEEEALETAKANVNRYGEQVGR